MTKHIFWILSFFVLLGGIGVANAGPQTPEGNHEDTLNFHNQPQAGGAVAGEDTHNSVVNGAVNATTAHTSVNGAADAFIDEGGQGGNGAFGHPQTE